MPDTVHHVMWYTVYDAKSGDLIASGTSEMCARRTAGLQKRKQLCVCELPQPQRQASGSQVHF